MAEIISQIEGAVYVERVTVSTPADVRKAKKAISHAFDIQEKRLGFTFVEILSTCPTNWGLTPTDSIKWLRENMIPYYPVKKFKDIEEVQE
jgi:2-oxoglutarate ferredoxin oxidoreductase subunit beta